VKLPLTAKCEYIKVSRGKGLFERCGAKCRIGEALCPQHMTKELTERHRLLSAILVPNWEFVQEQLAGVDEDAPVAPAPKPPRKTWREVREARKEALRAQRRAQKANRAARLAARQGESDGTP
jgi:hypothetical protein